ncbi:MAG: 4-vinyl reductase [Candidatus Bathyarchaeia archaeon]
MVISCTHLNDVVRGGCNETSRQTFKPLNIGRVMVFDEKQKIYGFAIESRVEKGNLRKLAELAESFGIIIRYIQFSMEDAGKPAVNVISFLDFSRAKVTPEETLEILKKSYDFVKNVKIIKPQGKCVIFDNYFFPLITAGERAVVFRRSVYEALFNGVREKFGTAGEAMLYYQGFSMGAEIFDDYMDIVKSNKLEDVIEVAKAMNMTLGWGVIDKVEIDTEKGRAKLRIYQSYECELSKKEKPQSQFYRGAIAGIFARFFGKDVEVKETKCIAMGDPYCEFEIKAAS